MEIHAYSLKKDFETKGRSATLPSGVFSTETDFKAKAS
jgi:hypothetical protein